MAAAAEPGMNALNVTEMTDAACRPGKRPQRAWRGRRGAADARLRLLAALLREQVQPAAGRQRHRPRAGRTPPAWPRRWSTGCGSRRKVHRDRGRRLRADRRHARPDRRDHRPAAPAERHQRRPDARAARRVRHDLREPAQRHHRGRVAGHQERQRLHPARRLGGASHSNLALCAAGAGRRWSRPACRPTRCSWCRPPTAPPSAS